MIWANRKAGLYFRIAVSVILLGVVLSFVDIEQVKSVIARISYGYFLVIVVFALADRAMMAFKWRNLITIKNICLSFNRALAIYLISGFVGVVLPTGIGADIYRIHYTSKILGGLQHVASSVVMERLMGITASTVFAVLGILVMTTLTAESSVDEEVLLHIFVVLAVLNILFILSMTNASFKLVNRLLQNLGKEKITNIVLSFHEAYLEFGLHKKVLLLFFFLSVIEQAFFVVITYFAALAIDVRIEWFYFIGIVPVCQILKRIPISINSIGVQEGLFAYFFTQVGMSVTEALSLSVLIRIAQWVVVLIGGVLYVTDSRVQVDSEFLQTKT